MLKKLFLNFLSGLAIGAGLALVAFIIIKKVDPKEESEYYDGEINSFSLGKADLIKTGRYLRLTGQIVEGDFTGLKDLKVQADVKLEDTFIERCWGKGFKDSANETWYYSVECGEITSDHFDLPFSNTVFIKSARYYKR